MLIIAIDVKSFSFATQSVKPMPYSATQPLRFSKFPHYHFLNYKTPTDKAIIHRKYVECVIHINIQHTFSL